MRIVKKSVILIATLVIIIIHSCLDFSNNWGRRYSVDSKQSKELDVFIVTYNPKTIIILDSVQLEIKNIIAENVHGIYSHDTDAPYEIDSTKSQIVLYIEPSQWKLSDNSGYRKIWRFSNMYSVRKNTWVIDINDPIPPDTIFIEVINDEADSTGGSGIHYGEKLDEFFIVKKENVK